jgi:predicted glycosyltransferase
LAEALNQWATCEFIPQEELLAGEMEPHLRRLLEKEQNWPDVPLNGAQVAAESILELLYKREGNPSRATRYKR